MFSSVFNTLKSHTEKLKESFGNNVIITPEHIQSLTTRLKDNVVQTSSSLKNSMTHNLQGFFSSTSTTSSLSSAYASLSTLSDNPSDCDKYNQKKYSSSFKPSEIRALQDEKLYRNERNVSLKWPLLENGNKTWVELVEIPTGTSTSNGIRNIHSKCATNAVNNDNECDSFVKTNSAEDIVISGRNTELGFFSDEEDEDENVTQKFTRITGIGYRASKVKLSNIFFWHYCFYTAYISTNPISHELI